MTSPDKHPLWEIPQVKPDPIFQLTAEFAKDSREKKVNLGVGIYHGEDLKPRLLRSVQAVEEKLAKETKPKSYLPIIGSQGFIDVIEKLIFGADSEVKKNKWLASAQTPGGTGALRLGGEALKALGFDTIYLSDPTWANHSPVFSRSGLAVKAYPYYDKDKQGVSFSKMTAFLDGLPEKSVILMHACCHNPTGCDLEKEEWNSLLKIFEQKKLIPFFDFAYQGFGNGIEEDAYAVRLFSEAKLPLLVAYSLSKNFGLYNERVGLFTAVLPDDKAAAKMQEFIKPLIRTLYSNPPAHGAKIAEEILTNSKLLSDWKEEVAQMGERVRQMRKSLASSLQVKCEKGDFSFLTRQKGMFSQFNFDSDQIHQLKVENAIFMPAGGRINMAGLTQRNIELVSEALSGIF